MTNKDLNLWEEKNLIERLKKYENSGVLDECGITKNIPTELNKENLKDITIKSWTRTCPKCNKKLFYKNKRVCKKACKLQTDCRRCSLKNPKNKFCKKYFRKCKICNKKIYSRSKYTILYFKNKPCKNCSHIGKKYNVIKKVVDINDLKRNCPKCSVEINYKSIESKKRADRQNRICMHCVGDNAIKHRKPFSKKSIRKMRFSKIKRLKNKFKFFKPNFNENACNYFNYLNKINGWNLQHALNKSEYYIKKLGYWLDAYDKKLNLVIEYDEPAHYDRHGNLKENDYARMLEIINYLQCRFMRYKEKTKELKEYKI